MEVGPHSDGALDGRIGSVAPIVLSCDSVKDRAVSLECEPEPYPSATLTPTQRNSAPLPQVQSYP